MLLLESANFLERYTRLGVSQKIDCHSEQGEVTQDEVTQDEVTPLGDEHNANTGSYL